MIQVKTLWQILCTIQRFQKFERKFEKVCFKSVKSFCEKLIKANQTNESRKVENSPLKKVEDKYGSVKPLPIESGGLAERKVSENSKPLPKPPESRWKELRPSEDSQQILASKVKKEKPMSQSLSMDNLLENISLGNRKISDSRMKNNFDFESSVTKNVLFSKSILSLFHFSSTGHGRRKNYHSGTPISPLFPSVTEDTQTLV